MKSYVAIDIGGTKMKYGLLSEQGELLQSAERDTEAVPGGGPHILALVKGIIEGYLREQELLGICLSSAGMVDIERGEIFASRPQIPNYVGTAFKRELEKCFGIPCEIENDVNCAGLSEGLLGAGRGAESSLCLTVGTGIGGCFVKDQEVYHGSSYSACEVGYLHLPGGLFEELASTSALCRRVEERKGEPGKWDGRRIFGQAKAGDTVCREEIAALCDYLGMGIANLCYVLNPERVILGGGIMQQRDYLYPLLRTSLDRYLVPALSEKTELRFAENGNHAGMLGAFCHFAAMQRKRELK